MKFGIHSLLFTETFLERDIVRLETFKNMGFDAVEIIPFDPDGFPAAQVRTAADALGVDINIGYGMPPDRNIISGEPAIRQAGITLTRQLIDLAAAAGAEVFGGVNYCGWGYLTGKPRTDEEWKWGVEGYRKIAEYASLNAPDLILAIEPVNRFESHFLNTAADAVRFVQEVAMPNVRVHLDTFHMIREEDDFAGAVYEAGPLLGYVHACENQRGIPGRGQVPWRSFFDALRKVKYDGCVTIESFDPNMPAIAKLCCIWRKLADSPEQLATEGLQFLRETLNRASA